MTIALRHAMTVDEFLGWASTQPEAPRAELINGQVVMMASERVVHNRLKASAFIALRDALARSGITGEAFIDGLTVLIDAFTAYEPDATVVLGAPLDGNGMTITDPVIVVEVISPTSAHSDTSAKLIGYFKLPSVLHYLVIDPDARAVTHHARTADDRVVARILDAGPLTLDPPGLVIEIAELFA
ncbi:Uma2 family endonuclease [Rhodoplanes elegans]|nr:Uma2 family endonuclease [Rhodoplanes elegans]